MLCFVGKWSKENTKVKKASRSEENDYGEENKMFLKLILLPIRRINLNILIRGAYSPTLPIGGDKSQIYGQKQ